MARRVLVGGSTRTWDKFLVQVIGALTAALGSFVLEGKLGTIVTVAGGAIFAAAPIPPPAAPRARR